MKYEECIISKDYLEEVRKMFMLEEISQLIDENKHEAAQIKIIKALNNVAEANITPTTEVLVKHCDGLAFLIAKLFTREDVKITPLFIKLNRIIAHVFYLSEMNTTDIVIRIILNHEKNKAVKLLTLYNFYCEEVVDLTKLQETMPQAYAEWFGCAATACKYDKKVYDKMMQHILNNFEVTEATLPYIWSMYFNISYMDISLEEYIKKPICDTMREMYKHLDINDFSDATNSVMVISRHWYKQHAVYKSMAGLLQNIPAKIPVYYVLLNGDEKAEKPDDCDVIPPPARIDEEFLLKVKTLVHKYKPKVIIYPDIGMTYESIALGNIRLAPVQMTCNGHPVTTYAHCVDMFLTGEMLRKTTTYTEQPYYLTGLGLYPVAREYNLKLKERTASSNEVRIGISWGLHKMHPRILTVLQKVEDLCQKRITWVVTTVPAKNLEMAVNKHHLSQFLKNVEMHPMMNYEQYMEVLETCDFAIDAAPFGSFNQILDWWKVGKPVVTYFDIAPSCQFSSVANDLIGHGRIVSTHDSNYMQNILYMTENYAKFVIPDEDYYLNKFNSQNGKFYDYLEILCQRTYNS